MATSTIKKQPTSTVSVYNGTVVYDASFGTATADTSSGAKTFTVTVPTGTTEVSVISCGGAYSNTYSVTSSLSGTTLTIHATAMNLSSGTHSLSSRFVIICFKSVSV